MDFNWSKDIDDLNPHYDDELAQSWVGKTILIGKTILDVNGNAVDQKQLYGVIKSVSAKDGFLVELQGESAGSTEWLPPDLRSFQDAPPGEYRLRSTGEVITDPDLLSTWTVTMRQDA